MIEYKSQFEKSQDNVTGEDLADIVGLQIALDVYKELLGVEYLNNTEFYDFIDLDYRNDTDTDIKNATLTLKDLSEEELANLYNIQGRLNDYKQ